MPRALTDKKKKKIVADYMLTNSLGEAAKLNHVCKSTVSRLIKKDTEAVELATRKKEQNSLDMLAYMDSAQEKVESIVEKYLEALGDPQKIEDASLQQVATSMGILIDKWTAHTANATAAGTDTPADELSKALFEVTKNATE